MNDREKAWERLRALIEAVEVAATISVRRSGRSRAVKIPWPQKHHADRPERLKLLRGELDAVECEAEVVIAPLNTPPGEWYHVPWPPPTDLWTAVDPPPSKPIVQGEENKGKQGVAVAERPVPESESHLVFTKVTLVERPAKASVPCAVAVLCILYHAKRRMSQSELLQAMIGKQEYQQSTIAHTCSWLVKDQVIDKGRDEYGEGYGLFDWDRVPRLEGRVIDCE